MTNNLKELAQQVAPGDIVSTYGVRKAMGISIPSPIVENNFVDLTEGTCLVSLGKWKAVVSKRDISFQITLERFLSLHVDSVKTAFVL